MSSSIGSGLKKTFKSITKNPLKALPLAFAAAAMVFTAGSAIGALPTWGSAMASATGSLGLSPTMTGVLTGALTNAGFGAAIGAGLSAVTGNDATTGAMIGGAAGAVQGGIAGGLQTAPPATGINTGTATPTGTSGTSPTGIMAGNVVTNPVGAAGGVPAVAAPAIDPSTQTIFGGLASGLGQGLLAGQSAKDDAKALMERDREHRQWMQNNYNMEGGLLTAADVPAEGSNPDPAQRFSTDFYDDREFQWDPAAGKLIRKPKAA